MCKDRNAIWVNLPKRRFKADRCIADLLYSLNDHGIETLGSCCGHGKYPMTIVYCFKKVRIADFISGHGIQRKKRFYVKDSEGFYYIPEVTHPLK